MVLTGFLGLLIITIFSLVYFKEKYNPITLFVGFWTMIFGMAYTNSFSINQASERTYSIVFAGVVAFAVGCLLFDLFSKNRRQIYKGNTIDIIQEGLDSKKINRIKIYSIIITLLMSMYAGRSVGYIMSGMDMTTLRQSFNDIVIQNNIERLLWMLFVVPSSFAIMAMDLYIYFVKKEKTFLYLSLFNTVLLSICNGGRLILFYFLIQSFFFSFIAKTNRDNEWIKKIKPTLQLGLIGAIIMYVMYAVSEGRAMEASYSESVNVYFSGCFPFFDYQIGLLDKSDIRMYGVSFFYAPITILEMIFTNAFGFDYSSELIAARNIIYSLQESIDIGSTSKFNAFATLFFYFYMDGGVPGVCIESAVYGILCCYVFNKVRYYKNPRFCMLYAIIINSIFSSMVRWQLADVGFTLAILYIILFTNRNSHAHV